MQYINTVDYYNCKFTLYKNDNVIGWTNIGSDKVYMGSKEPSAPSIAYNSTVKGVIAVLGTPVKVEFTFKWYYEDSSINFDNNWVINGILIQEIYLWNRIFFK